MNILKAIALRCRALFRKRELDREMDDEMRFHVEMQTQENIKAGLQPKQAREAALRNFGGLDQIREIRREMRGVNWIENFLQDFRYACRMLRKNPGFTIVAVLSLALGIGANTALFSVVYGVLISPYPYAKPQTMWWPGLQTREGNRVRSYRLKDYMELAQLPVFDEVMGTSQGDMLLTGTFAPESVHTVRLTASAFRFLGVSPLIGRVIGPSDIQPNGDPEPVVVLSHGAWQRLLGGRPGALGEKLKLDDQEYTIIGVMPPRFGWYTSEGVWIPMRMNRQEQNWVNPLVRLKAGVSPVAAEQQLQVLNQSFAREEPSEFPKEAFISKLTNYLDVTVASGDMQTSLHLLFGAVGFLLLIVCANVANLQLARSTARAREMAIRLSVGAGRRRLLRQLLTESVLLSFLGGVVGLVFAVWTTKLMVTLMPSFYVPNEARVELNGPVLLFCLLVSLLTGIIFGLAPAFHLSRPDLTEALKDSGRGSGTSTRGGRTRELLVVAEVALSVVLLVSAGLTVRSFIALQHVDLGFQPDRVLLMQLPLTSKRYATLEQRNRFTRELLERVQSLAGVQAAALGGDGVLFGGPDSTYAIDGPPGPEKRRLNLDLASPDFLRTAGIPLKRGRMFDDREVNAAAPVVLINEAALGLWPPGEDPIGKRLRLDLLEKPWGKEVLTNAGASPYVTVIGVFGNTRNDGRAKATQPAAMVPYTLLAPPERILAIRALGNPELLITPLRAQASEMDKEQPLGRHITARELLGFDTVQPRFVMALFSLFATLGLALAMAGIYSVLSYLVTQRTQEIGVRMALGAQREDVLGLIFKVGGRLVLVGMVLGVGAGLGVARLMRGQLYQVTAFDPVSFLGVVVLLTSVAVAACYIPARRATQVDPMVALRYE